MTGFLTPLLEFGNDQVNRTRTRTPHTLSRACISAQLQLSTLTAGSQFATVSWRTVSVSSSPKVEKVF
jgi:hypothetical protein